LARLLLATEIAPDENPVNTGNDSSPAQEVARCEPPSTSA
jgi:hypothetical protein